MYIQATKVCSKCILSFDVHLPQRRLVLRRSHASQTTSSDGRRIDNCLGVRTSEESQLLADKGKKRRESIRVEYIHYFCAMFALHSCHDWKHQGKSRSLVEHWRRYPQRVCGVGYLRCMIGVVVEQEYIQHGARCKMQPTAVASFASTEFGTMMYLSERWVKKKN